MSIFYPKLCSFKPPKRSTGVSAVINKMNPANLKGLVLG